MNKKKSTTSLEIVRIFFLIISLLSSGKIFYDSINTSFGISSIYLCFILIPCTLLCILIPTRIRFKRIPRNLSSFTIWLLCAIFVFGGIFLVHEFRNLSPTIFSTKFYWEEGLDIDFRENGTYKASHNNIMTSRISYGKYKIEDKNIILLDKMMFGMAYLKDTLSISGAGAFFTMEKPWRVSEGMMSFDYNNEANFKIINKTSFHLDSIQITPTYRKEPFPFNALKPGQDMDFQLKKEQNNSGGKYKMTYKAIHGSSTLTKIKDLTNGYPLESIRSITFEEEYMNIDFVFGNTLKKIIK